MIAAVWSSLVDVALGGAAVVLLALVCRVWRLEDRVRRLERSDSRAELTRRERRG